MINSDCVPMVQFLFLYIFMIATRCQNVCPPHVPCSQPALETPVRPRDSRLPLTLASLDLGPLNQRCNQKRVSGSPSLPPTPHPSPLLPSTIHCCPLKKKKKKYIYIYIYIEKRQTSQFFFSYTLIVFPLFFLLN